MAAERVSQKLLKVIAGDREAGAWFYDTFAPRLYRLLCQRYGTGGELDPDDLVSEVFVFFLQSRAKVLRDFLENVPEAEQTETVLFRRLWALARGVVANRRRYNRTHGFDPLPEFVEISSQTDLEAETIHRELQERLDACLKHKNRRVYLYYKLRYRDGLTPKEITRVTGWSHKAVYKLKASLDEAVRECALELGIIKDQRKSQRGAVDV